MSPLGNVYRHRLSDRIVFVVRQVNVKRDCSGTLRIGKHTAGWLTIQAAHLDRDWIKVSD